MNNNLFKLIKPLITYYNVYYMIYNIIYCNIILYYLIILYRIKVLFLSPVFLIYI